MTDRKCLIHEHFVPHPATAAPHNIYWIKKALGFVSSNDNIPYHWIEDLSIWKKKKSITQSYPSMLNYKKESSVTTYINNKNPEKCVCIMAFCD